jgi:hypothetical protein
MASPEVMAGMTQSMHYTNEYCDMIATEITMTMFCPDGEQVVISPVLKEKHFCKFLFRTTSPGMYNAEIRLGDQPGFYTSFGAY